MDPSSSGRPAGFTLVELIVALVIITFVSALGLRLFQSLNSSHKSISQRAALQMDARRAFDKVAGMIREGTDVVRPFMGETLPFLVFKDLINRTTVLYLEPNNKASERLNMRVYKLISYRTEDAGPYDKRNEQTLVDTVKRISFTSLSPNGVQVNVTVFNERDEFQFLAHIGLMNIGGLE